MFFICKCSHSFSLTCSLTSFDVLMGMPRIFDARLSMSPLNAISKAGHMVVVCAVRAICEKLGVGSLLLPSLTVGTWRASSSQLLCGITLNGNQPIQQFQPSHSILLICSLVSLFFVIAAGVVVIYLVTFRLTMLMSIICFFVCMAFVTYSGFPRSSRTKRSGASGFGENKWRHANAHGLS